MKYGVIEQMRQDYPVPPMCRVLDVSVSGYYAWRKRKPSERTRQEPRDPASFSRTACHAAARRVSYSTGVQ